MAILRLKDVNGNVHNVAAIVGPRGPEGRPGKDGTGTGDMVAETYDPAGGRRQVAFDDDLAAVAKSGNYNDLTGKPSIPSAVTESTVSDWGFTKNDGTYSKPGDGIPKSDLDAEVKGLLDKADTALQSFVESDPVFSVSPAARITNGDITTWNGKANVGDIPAVPAWAMESNKPDYTASEVHARPDTWTPSKSDVGLGNVDNAQQYSASNPPPYPVTSVNGQTGDVIVQGGGSTPAQYSGIIPISAWSSTTTNGFYTATVNNDNIIADYTVSPDIDIDWNNVTAGTEDYVLVYFGVLCKADTQNGSIKFYAFAKPEIAIPFVIRVFP